MTPLPPLAERARRARAILAKLGIASIFLACAGGQLDPKAQRAVDRVECVVRAVEPHCGDVVEATQLVAEWFQGKADLPRALRMLGATAPELEDISVAVNACLNTPPAPVPTPAVIHVEWR